MNSSFKPYIAGFIREKKALGYVFKTEENYLRSFDEFIANVFPNEKSLTKEMIELWVNRLPLANVTKCRKISTLNGLGRYMIRYGANADLIPYTHYPHYQKDFKARILSVDEIQRILNAADNFPVNSIYPRLHCEVSMLFHLLVNAGFRISELLDMRMNSVDLESGILTVEKGKNMVSRIVPLSEIMHERLKAYAKKVYRFSKPESVLFPGTRSEKLQKNAVTRYFRFLLEQADIPYLGKGYGPRVHDLRHTFAVQCLRKWLSENQNLDTCLPVLPKFMGHSGLKATQRYIQVTQEMYEQIIKRMSTTSNTVIAKGDFTND